MRGRRPSRAHPSKSSATIWPSTARRPITASRSCRNCRLRMSRRGCPAATATIMRAILRPLLPASKARCASPRSICPMATRPIPTNTPTSSPGWTGSSTARVQLLALEQPWCLPAITTSYRPRSMQNFPTLGRATRCFFRELALNIAASWRSDSPTPCAAASPAPAIYTFWDYQAGAWQKNNGIRIDHCLLSPQAADRFVSARIDKHVRGWEKPSDHVPVVIELDV